MIKWGKFIALSRMLLRQDNAINMSRDWQRHKYYAKCKVAIWSEAKQESRLQLWLRRRLNRELLLRHKCDDRWQMRASKLISNCNWVCAAREYWQHGAEKYAMQNVGNAPFWTTLQITEHNGTGQAQSIVPRASLTRKRICNCQTIRCQGAAAGENPFCSKTEWNGTEENNVASRTSAATKPFNFHALSC